MGRDVIVEMRDHLKSDGFSIEMEMISKMVILGYSMYSVPISYNIREGETKIESIKDGLKILFTFFRILSWSPPKASVGKKNNDQQITFNVETVDMPDPAYLLKTLNARETT